MLEIVIPNVEIKQKCSFDCGMIVDLSLDTENGMAFCTSN